MKTVLITFWAPPNGNYHLGRNYEIEGKRLLESAQRVGLATKGYDREWLESTKEYGENPDTFSHITYAWAFKSLAILDTLNNLEDGDNVIWCDSNHFVLRYPHKIINTAIKNNIFVHDHYPVVYYNRHWTNRQLFYHLGCDEEKYWNAVQLHANVLCFHKNDFVMNFVNEWKTFNCDYKTAIDTSEMPNYPDWRRNSYDQSIISLLITKNGIPVQQYSDEEIIEL